MFGLGNYLFFYNMIFLIGNNIDNFIDWIFIIIDLLVLDKIFFRIKFWQILYGYIFFLFCLFGIIGNVLFLVILIRKVVRFIIIFIYFRCLVMVDFFVLLIVIFRYRSYKFFFDDEGEKWFIYYFDFYVQVYVEFIYWMALGVFSFIILVLFMERYLVVRYLIRIKRICIFQVVRVVIIGIMIIVFIISIFNFFVYRVGMFLRDNKFYVVVVMLIEMGKKILYYCVYYSYFILFLWYILLWIMFAVFSILFFKNVRKFSKIRVDILVIFNFNRNLTFFIIMIVVLFLICNFLNCIIVFYNLVYYIMDNDVCIYEIQGFFSKIIKLYDVLEVIGEILNVFNSCINFIVYCVVGIKFRRELKRFILCEKCKKKRNNRIVFSYFYYNRLRDIIIEVIFSIVRQYS